MLIPPVKPTMISPAAPSAPTIMPKGVATSGSKTGKAIRNAIHVTPIAVTASVYEGFGLPCAEAMSCGTPVIATRAGALPEIVGNDGAGILVPPADPPALAEAIKRLLADDSLRAKMGATARKRIEESFSWEVAAQKTLEVYREVI